MEHEKIILPIRISRNFVKKHFNYIFIYGNDYYNKGCLGQAWEFANESNTYRIPTLWKYCANPVFFNDCNFDDIKYLIDTEIAKIPRDTRPIIVVRKIGEGASRMKELAPKCFEYLRAELAKIATPTEINYRWERA